MDFKTLPRDAKSGERYLLLLVCLLTKYVWAQVSGGKPAVIVRAFLESLWYRWSEEGLPKPDILHSDNGGEFANEVVDQFCNAAGVEYRHGLPGHPQAQGAIERVVGTFVALLKCRIPEYDTGQGDVAWVEKYVRF